MSLIQTEESKESSASAQNSLTSSTVSCVVKKPTAEWDYLLNCGTEFLQKSWLRGQDKGEAGLGARGQKVTLPQGQPCSCTSLSDPIIGVVGLPLVPAWVSGAFPGVVSPATPRVCFVNGPRACLNGAEPQASLPFPVPQISTCMWSGERP